MLPPHSAGEESEFQKAALARGTGTDGHARGWPPTQPSARPGPGVPEAVPGQTVPGAGSRPLLTQEGL